MPLRTFRQCSMIKNCESYAKICVSPMNDKFVFSYDTGIIYDYNQEYRIMRIRKNKNYDLQLDGIDLELIASVSDALAHPVRLLLFRYIMQRNRKMKNVCTKDLTNVFDYAQATISQHMKRLVKSGLVEVKKVDRFNYYFANMGVLMRYLDASKKFSVIKQ